MVQTSLTGRISIIRQLRGPNTINATNVDNASRVLQRPSLLHQRQRQLRQSKHALQVERQDLSPRGIGICVDFLAPVGGGVVDEDVEAVWFGGGDFGNDALAFRDLLEVGGDGGDGAEGGEVVDGSSAGFGVAAGDVDFCAGGYEAFSDHAADAFGAWAELVGVESRKSGWKGNVPPVMRTTLPLTLKRFEASIVVNVRVKMVGVR